jgi:hypothetical protein
VGNSVVEGLTRKQRVAEIRLQAYIYSAVEAEVDYAEAVLMKQAEPEERDFWEKETRRYERKLEMLNARIERAQKIFLEEV